MKLPLAFAFLLAGCAATPPSPAPAPAPAPAASSEEWDRELGPDVYLVDEDDHAATHEPTRVVDDATGNPIPGATIDNWWEADNAMPGAWDDLREQSAVTDRDGRALLRREGMAPWYYVAAPGYGAQGEMALQEEYRLRRGVDVTVEVRDFLDRPLPGATAEVLLGCGHTPFILERTSGRDGRVSLPCLDTEAARLWVRGAGVTGRNDAYNGDVDDLEVQGDVRILRCGPAPVIEGTVLDAAGKPAPGVVVGLNDSHRGPWTRTAADGTFRLLGAPPYEQIEARVPRKTNDDSRSWEIADAQTLPGRPVTIRLPAPEPEEEEEESEESEEMSDEESEEPETGLRVTLLFPAGPPPEEEVDVLVVRLSDGASDEMYVSWEEGGKGRDVLDLEPGEWEVLAGSTGGRYAKASARVTVGKTLAEVTIPLRENARWRPRILRSTGEPVTFPFDGEIWIRAADWDEEAVPVEGEEGAFYVPASGPFAVEVQDVEDMARATFEGPPGADAPPLRLAPVVLAPDPGLMEIPYEGDFPEATVRVLLPDGTPCGAADVTVSGSHASNMHYSVHRRMGDDGTFEYAFRRHDRVEVRPFGQPTLPPLVTRIEGPGPWTLRWPSGSLAVRAVDAAGAPIPEFTVILDEGNIEAAGGTAVVRGVAPGAVRLLVAAPGRLAHDLRVLVRDGERREVLVRLNPR